MNRQKIDRLFTRFQAHNPEPKTELEYTNPFTMLVAIVLSAQMTDSGVNKATRALFPIAGTPQAILEMGEEKLGEYIKTINFHRGKTKNVIALSRMLIEEFGGEIPRTREELERLPGVGCKTANVWLNNILGLPTIGVDTHVFRVANRLGLCNTSSAEATEIALEKVVPEKWKTHAHHWLILHGRYVCVARKPKCPQCLVRDLCEFKNKTA